MTLSNNIRSFFEEPLLQRHSKISFMPWVSLQIYNLSLLKSGIFIFVCPSVIKFIFYLTQERIRLWAKGQNSLKFPFLQQYELVNDPLGSWKQDVVLNTPVSAFFHARPLLLLTLYLRKLPFRGEIGWVLCSVTFLGHKSNAKECHGSCSLSLCHRCLPCQWSKEFDNLHSVQQHVLRHYHYVPSLMC